MAEPTTTRNELRQAICRELNMDFAKRYSSARAVTSGTTTTIVDSGLAQPDDFWNNQWMYLITSGQQERISDWASTSNTFTLESTISSPSSDETYEILSVWNALDVHEAINRAIDEAFPAFFDVITDETLVLCEDKLQYDLSSLTTTPWVVNKIWVETSPNARQGKVTSAAAGTLVDTTADFSGVTSSWKVSIYEGTGAGQLRSVSSVVGTTLNISANWTTTPDTSSKYNLWNPTEQEGDWQRVQGARFDAKEYPTTLYLSENPGHEGLRIRLQYVCKPAALSTNAATTIVPKEYVLRKALSILFGMRINDNRTDRQRYVTLTDYWSQLAEQYKKEHSFSMPDVSIWTPTSTASVSNSDDPLKWG